METEARLTKLASCAGCGAKVGAGTLSKLLQDFKTRTDPRLIVGFDKSDDASVYVINDETALIQTVDFFPPIVDDPYLFGQIAATNAISDIYAMGGEPRLALNILCVTETMEEEWIREILRGGYDKAYEAGVIISGGHTIHGSEPLYGLAVTGFAKPEEIRKNDAAKPGDALILTKKLGVGILTTAAKAGMMTDRAVAGQRMHTASSGRKHSIPSGSAGNGGYGTDPRRRVPEPGFRGARGRGPGQRIPGYAGYPVRSADQRRTADRRGRTGRGSAAEGTAVRDSRGCRHRLRDGSGRESDHH